MELKTAAFYCLCDDFLISEGWRDDPQCAMSVAEVMTAVLTAAAFFSGSYERSCKFLKRHGYAPAMLSKSQLIRRLRRIPESVWRGLMSQLAAPFHESDSLKIYLADRLQNISGRMLPWMRSKPEGIFLRAESSCADD